jgi:hypothetical protein
VADIILECMADFIGIRTLKAPALVKAIHLLIST